MCKFYFNNIDLKQQNIEMTCLKCRGKINPATYIEIYFKNKGSKGFQINTQKISIKKYQWSFSVRKNNCYTWKHCSV